MPNPVPDLTARPPSRRRYATIRDAAAYMDCDAWTIRRAITRGDLRSYRYGRTIRVDLGELDSLLERGGAR